MAPTYSTYEDLQRFLPDEGAALALFTRLRLANDLGCPHCGHDKIYPLRDEEHYKCAYCGRRFSIRAGTIFEGTKLPIGTWLDAIWFLVNQPDIPSTELAQKLVVTQKTAWLMLNRLRRAARTASFRRPLRLDPIADLAIKDAVWKLSASVMYFSLPGDTNSAEIAMARLFGTDHTLDPVKIRQWAIRRGWDVSSARELEAIARQAQIEAKRIARERRPKSRYKKRPPMYGRSPKAR